MISDETHLEKRDAQPGTKPGDLVNHRSTINTKTTPVRISWELEDINRSYSQYINAYPCTECLQMDQLDEWSPHWSQWLVLFFYDLSCCPLSLCLLSFASPKKTETFEYKKKTDNIFHWQVEGRFAYCKHIYTYINLPFILSNRQLKYSIYSRFLRIRQSRCGFTFHL